jgi:hypothetical protein
MVPVLKLNLYKYKITITPPPEEQTRMINRPCAGTGSLIAKSKQIQKEVVSENPA